MMFMNMYNFMLLVLLTIIITTFTTAKAFSESAWTNDINKNVYSLLPEYEENVVVMSFNIWNSGANVQDGIFKIAKHILYNYPDIVAIQELMTSSLMDPILRYLGPGWKSVAVNNNYPDVAIITRHEILSSSDWVADGHPQTAGYIWAKIKVTNRNSSSLVNFWSVHLDWRDYGPYAACNKLVTEKYQIDAGEWGRGRENYGRAEQAYFIVNSMHYQQHMSEIDRNPLILAGDFNSPSHLDWIADTAKAHCDWAYAWPTTVQMTNTGLKDSFRELYSDPLKNPGLTWSTVRNGQDGWNGTIPEPQDRIDMIFYASHEWKPKYFSVYSGLKSIKPYPLHRDNDYPSDHYAVISTFHRWFSSRPDY